MSTALALFSLAPVILWFISFLPLIPFVLLIPFVWFFVTIQAPGTNFSSRFSRLLKLSTWVGEALASLGLFFGDTLVHLVPSVGE